MAASICALSVPSQTTATARPVSKDPWSAVLIDSAACRLRSDFRVFRLSRMREPELLNKHFHRRGANYKDYLGPWNPEGPPARQPDAVSLERRFRPEARFLVEEYFEGERRLLRLLRG